VFLIVSILTGVRWIIAIKTAWYRHKNKYEGHWNRIKDLDMNPNS
jgi:hypothetical protein